MTEDKMAYCAHLEQLKLLPQEKGKRLYIFCRGENSGRFKHKRHNERQ